MRHFLFVHMHWLWTCLHWGYDLIHHWVAFLLVLAVGVIQTILTYLGGKMSVPPTLRKSEQKHKLLPFKRWGAALCLLFLLVGVLNDQNQYHADQKADLVVGQGVDLGKKFTAFLDEFPNGPPPATTSSGVSRDDLKTYHRELNELRVLAQGLSAGSIAPPPATAKRSGIPTTTNVETPFSKLSNSELKESVRIFVIRAKTGSTQILDDQEKLSKLQMSIGASLAYPQSESVDQRVARFASQQQSYDKELNSFIEAQLPLANQYLTELLKRLGSQSKPILTFSIEPNITSVDHYGGRVMILNDLATTLPDN